MMTKQLLLVFSATLILACAPRTLQQGEDGGLGADAFSPTGDLVASGAVTVLLDKSTYSVFAQPQGTIVNGSAETIYVDGCSPLSSERQHNGGGWKDYGAAMDCFAPGNAQAIAPGGELSGQPVLFHEPGRWRAALSYGVGCDPQRPLHDDTCQRREVAHSTIVDVKATAADCQQLAKQYVQRVKHARSCMATTLPNPCTTSAPETIYGCGCWLPINAGGAKQLESLRQRFSDWSCENPDGPCPPLQCESPLPAHCVNGLCTTR